MSKLFTLEEVEKLVEKAFNQDTHLDPAKAEVRGKLYEFFYYQIENYARSGNMLDFEEHSKMISKAWAKDEISFNAFEVLMMKIKKLATEVAA